ncbi:uncharacterized protein [Gossypium hirsutum]|uniref:Uncharacterized protein n=1 Tax=Gossypium hirsutum TaxID=3635 RepID=A0ABM2ZYJ5_GOSHI|nr:uncharacterized protein LOC121216096 [Gossypium hirsutum]
MMLRSGKQTDEPTTDSTIAPQGTGEMIPIEKVEFEELVDVSDKKVNIPLADAFVQILNYGKFLKELLSKKKKISDMETIARTEGCSTVLTNKFPQNERSLTLQLADRSLAQLEGKIKDIIVRMDKFILPADFIILDCEADKEVPINLGQPFLATEQTLIDVYKGEITMRLNDELITFSVFESIQGKDKEDCHILNVLDDLIQAEFDNQCTILSEEFVLTSDDEFVYDCENMVKASNIELRHG